MQHNPVAKLLIIVGILLVLAGVIYYFWADYFRWIGRLPGDIRIERENMRFYFPITTMILLSVFISILFNLIKKLF